MPSQGPCLMVRFIISRDTSLLYSLQEDLYCCSTLTFFLASLEKLLFIMVVLLCLILFAGGICCIVGGPLDHL